MRSFWLTLVCSVLYLAPVWGQTADQRQATVVYLQHCQQANGGFVPAKAGGAPSGGAKSSLRASSAALRALKYFGGESRDQASCGRFVQRCFDKGSGGFADHPGTQPDVTSTAVGIMALIELKLPVDDYRAAAAKYLAEHVKSCEDIRIAAAGFEAIGERPRTADLWLEQIAKLRYADGTYGMEDGVARATGGAVAAVLRLGGNVEHKDHVLQVLKAGQRADGGFGKERAKTSDLESSYRVMRAFVMLNDKPAAERFRSFVASCRNPDGGYGVAPGEPSSVSATYFAAAILHWLKEE
jgi:prenyltransferase beta subunit